MFANANTGVRVLRDGLRRAPGEWWGGGGGGGGRGTERCIPFEKKRRWYFWKCTAAAGVIIYGKNTCGGLTTHIHSYTCTRRRRRRRRLYGECGGAAGRAEDSAGVDARRVCKYTRTHVRARAACVRVKACARARRRSGGRAR